jgi:hypothetical protein
MLKYFKPEYIFRVLLLIFIAIITIFLMNYKYSNLEHVFYEDFFQRLNNKIKNNEEFSGKNLGMINLDNLDKNIDIVVNTLKDFNIMLSTKSIPSINLLKYIMKRANLYKLMVKI